MAVDLHQGSNNRAAKWLLSSTGLSIMPRHLLAHRAQGRSGSGMWQSRKWLVEGQRWQTCHRRGGARAEGQSFECPEMRALIDRASCRRRPLTDCAVGCGRTVHGFPPLAGRERLWRRRRRADHEDTQEWEPAGCGDSTTKRIQRLMQSEENVGEMGSVHLSHWFVCRGGGGCEWFDDCG